VIYFMQPVGGGPVKIGVTTCVRARKATLEKEHGVGLVVIGVMHGKRPKEQELHKAFDHLRLRGEWFEGGPELAEFIRKHSIPWDGTDPEATPPLPTVVSIKGTAAWRDWVQLLAEDARTDAAKLIDSLLAEHAKKRGLPAPPKR